MRFASAISAATNANDALSEVLSSVEKRLTPGMADLVMFFVTAHFEDELEAIVESLTRHFTGAVLIGCTAEGTIGDDRELERMPSMSLLVGSMPGVAIRPFQLRQAKLQATDSLAEWERILGILPESNPTIVAFADPFRIAVPTFIDQMNKWYPEAPVVGGIASAAHQPEQNRLILNGQIHREGIIGISLSGNVNVQTVVSQGCRPIGRPFVITKGERNIIFQLGGKEPLKQLQSVISTLTPADDLLARQSLFMGRVIDERKETFARGDFLIHNILGFDRRSGAISIAGHARIGATVQFHVRDADSADEDLRSMLAPHRGSKVRGAMLFGCNGRGTHMWPQPGHDIGVLRECLGDVPVAGFFCGGEFGPIGGRSFVHGFTASIVLFQPRESDPAVDE